MIRHQATMTKKVGGKVVGGVYEVSMQGQGRKLLPLLELKERSGVKRINHRKKIEEWLNSEEGIKWALEVDEGSVD